MKHSLDKRFLQSILVNIAALTTTTFAATHHQDIELQRLGRSHIEIGKASWYGPGFNGRPCADGSRFDQRKLTAAHRTLPLGTEVQVVNLANGKAVNVKITDRGPYSEGRVLDLSKAAADRLHMTQAGVTTVRIVATALTL